MGEAGYRSIASSADFSALSVLGEKLVHQVHHFLPLYLGGTHEQGNLMQAEGHAAKDEVESEDPQAKPARVAVTAHAKLHEMIDTTSIADFLEQDTAVPRVTLSWRSLASAFPMDSLNILIGELGPRGAIKYTDTERRLIGGTDTSNS